MIVYGNHIEIENVITIQPNDIRLQIKSNNLIIGLTLAIIALTVVVVTAKYDRFGISIKD